MQKIVAFSLLSGMLLLTRQTLTAQTNTFPTTGNAGIGTLSPASPLDIRATVPATGGVACFQTTATNSNAASVWFANSLNATQNVATTGDFVTLTTNATTAHPSGNVNLAIPISVVNIQSGAGTVGEVHVIDDRMLITATAGNINNAMCFWGTFGIQNGGTPVNTITNGYGLYINTFPTNVTNKYGVFINDATANNYFAGHLTIGTTNPQGYSLAVNGSAIFTQAVVKTFANWPDYVFHKEYELPPLDSVAAYIRQNDRLPGMPSAGEVQDKGVDLGGNQALLLKKIEELTLYLIQQKGQLEEQQKEIAELKKKVRK